MCRVTGGCAYWGRLFEGLCGQKRWMCGHCPQGWLYGQGWLWGQAGTGWTLVAVWTGVACVNGWIVNRGSYVDRRGLG